jgi:hypothetical protein
VTNWQNEASARQTARSHKRVSFFLALLGALLIGLMPTTCAAQERVNVVQVAPVEPVMDSLWSSVLPCADDKRVPEQNLKGLVWFLRDPVIIDRPFREHPDTTLGEWVPGGAVAPDTIYLSRGHESDGWVIAHELLHHAMAGPPQGDPHPRYNFGKCNLL